MKKVYNLLFVITISLFLGIIGLSNVNADNEPIRLEADFITDGVIQLAWESDKIDEEDVEYSVYYKSLYSETYQVNKTNDRYWLMEGAEQGVEYTFYVEATYNGELLKSNTAKVEISPYAPALTVVNNGVEDVSLTIESDNTDGKIKEYRVYRTGVADYEDDDIVLIDTIDDLDSGHIENIISLNDLLQNTQYKFYVEAVLDDGTVVRSNSQTIITMGINLIVSSDVSELSLNWNYNDESGEVNKYEIYLGQDDESGETNYNLIETINDQYETSYSISEGIKKNTDYYIYIVAVLENGERIKSKVETVNTEEGISVDSKTLSGNEVYLFWNYDEDYYGKLTNFKVYKTADDESNNWVLVGTTNDNSFTVKNLVKRTVYTFRVVGTDKYGDEVEGMSGIFKTPSFGLSGTVIEDNKIQLNWSYDGSDGIVEKYEVYNITDESNLLATTDSTSYVVNNVNETQSYVFAVSAILQNGKEVSSNHLLVLNNSNITVSGVKDIEYNGESVENHNISVKYGAVSSIEQNEQRNTFSALPTSNKLVFELEENKDYTTSYKNNINVGTATITIKGNDYFAGEVTKTFNILPKSIANGVSISGIVNKTYNGKAQTQKIVMKYNNKTLVKDKDYSVYYSNNKNTGTSTISIFGIGNYTGKITKTFKIFKAKNPFTLKYYNKTVYYSKVKNSAQVVKPIYLNNIKNAGKITYEKQSGSSSRLLLNKTTGKVTVKKGTKKGTYKIRIKVRAAGNSNYNSNYKIVTITIRVK